MKIFVNGHLLVLFVSSLSKYFHKIKLRRFLFTKVDKIYENGRDAVTNEYVIPDELTSLAEILQNQLQLLETSSIRSKSKNVSEKTSNTDQETKTETEDDSSDSKEFNGEVYVLEDLVAIPHEPGKILEKLKQAAPYNIFLPAIKDSIPTHTEPLTVTFQEIFDKSLGEIESTVQINYMVDFNWLIMNYELAGIIDKPSLVLFGLDYTPDEHKNKKAPQLTAFEVKMPQEYGIPHAKITIFFYTDNSLRIIISTSNLIFVDWKNRTQALWMSSKLKALPVNSSMADGDSSTNFRRDFISFLQEYKCPHLELYIERIRKTDFGEINVFFIASAPGIYQQGPHGFPYGHAHVGEVLRKHCAPINEKVSVVCQSSGIGTYGPNIKSWIQHDFLNSFSKDTERRIGNKIAPLNFIFPSLENVCNGHNGIFESGWLSSERSVNDKQLWLRKYLYQWKCDVRHRTAAIPHMKCYARFDFEEKSVFWFLLTSSNFSKSAWGSFHKNIRFNPGLRMANFEAGVLFLPNFVVGEQTFPLGYTRNGIPPFPLPYDVPLTSYKPEDKIYTMEDASEIIEKIYEKIDAAIAAEKLK